MTISVLDTAMISDFVAVEQFSTEMLSKIELEFIQIVQSIKDEKLRDWEICFRFIYNNVRQILIYTKNKSYPKEKYKEIIVHIPMPTKDKAVWGVYLEQHVYKNENHLDDKIKNFNCLNVDYSKFTNREEYIIDCMRRAIKFCFEVGFTINGVKVQL